MEVLSILIEAENALPDTVTDMVFSGRRFTFPLVLNDQWCNDAISQYMKTIRNKAVYLPSNIEYLAHNNGLANSEVALEKLVESDHVSHAILFVIRYQFILACTRGRILPGLSIYCSGEATYTLFNVGLLIYKFLKD